MARIVGKKLPITNADDAERDDQRTRVSSTSRRSSAGGSTKRWYTSRTRLVAGGQQEAVGGRHDDRRRAASSSTPKAAGSTSSATRTTIALGLRGVQPGNDDAAEHADRDDQQRLDEDGAGDPADDRARARALVARREELLVHVRFAEQQEHRRQEQRERLRRATACRTASTWSGRSAASAGPNPPAWPIR